MKSFLVRLKQQRKGQSFVELAIVFMLLLSMFAGVIELGNLLNQYITLVDGAREGARAASNADPFLTTGLDDYNATFYTDVDGIIEGTFDGGGTELTKPAIDPLKLIPANDDDVVISVFGVQADGNVKRFPAEFPNGWSKHGKQTSKFTIAEFDALLDQFILTYGAAPGTGMVVVEIYYHYESLLKLPFVPTTVPVHVYSIMPLTAAEPTPTP
jgi:hypothetical protein